jgi:hypothetical protein
MHTAVARPRHHCLDLRRQDPVPTGWAINSVSKTSFNRRRRRVVIASAP